MARVPKAPEKKEPSIGEMPISRIARSAAPLRQNVVDALRTAIVEGRLAPGARLTERGLIDMTGVSRTVIREALRQLESEGVIETIPNKGPIVRQLTLGEATDLYLIRSVLEGLAARMFVANAGSEDMISLKGALDSTIAAYRGGDPDVILKEKNRFYDILFRGAGSDTLSSMIETLHARIWRWRALGLGHPMRSRSRSQESIKGLRGLFKAIEQRDADEAEEIARAEVTKAGSEITRIFEAERKSAENAG
jgi:GntR family transcriptional regulator, trigonelline degradation regulator